MKKTLLSRILLGIPLGIALGTLISLFSSWVFSGEYYAACVPAMVQAVGSELKAVTLQTVLCGLLGAVFAGASVIWDMETWSILKQTGLYFLLTSLVMLPVAYLTHWMEHSLIGVLCYAGLFTAIFLVVWLAQYFAWRRRIHRLNQTLP